MKKIELMIRHIDKFDHRLHLQVKASNTEPYLDQGTGALRAVDVYLTAKEMTKLAVSAHYLVSDKFQIENVWYPTNMGPVICRLFVGNKIVSLNDWLCQLAYDNEEIVCNDSDKCVEFGKKTTINTDAS